MTFESVLTIIILVNAMATITLWQRAARRPEKLKKSFRNRLWKGKPITPKHEPPPPRRRPRYDEQPRRSILGRRRERFSFPT
jgi:hypothetical protein